jgi:hypothetical protein
VSELIKKSLTLETFVLRRPVRSEKVSSERFLDPI